MPAPDRADGAEGVADEMWLRVRRLAGEAERLRAAVDEEVAPSDEALTRLSRVRLRAARAADRAAMADALADQLAELAASRRATARHAGLSGASQPEATGP